MNSGLRVRPFGDADARVSADPPADESAGASLFASALPLPLCTLGIQLTEIGSAGLLYASRGSVSVASRLHGCRGGVSITTHVQRLALTAEQCSPHSLGSAPGVLGLSKMDTNALDAGCTELDFARAVRSSESLDDLLQRWRLGRPGSASSDRPCHLECVLPCPGLTG